MPLDLTLPSTHSVPRHAAAGTAPALHCACRSAHTLASRTRSCGTRQRPPRCGNGTLRVCRVSDTRVPRRARRCAAQHRTWPTAAGPRGTPCRMPSRSRSAVHGTGATPSGLESHRLCAVYSQRHRTAYRSAPASRAAGRGCAPIGPARAVVPLAPDRVSRPVRRCRRCADCRRRRRR